MVSPSPLRYARHRRRTAAVAAAAILLQLLLPVLLPFVSAQAAVRLPVCGTSVAPPAPAWLQQAAAPEPAAAAPYCLDCVLVQCEAVVGYSGPHQPIWVSVAAPVSVIPHTTIHSPLQAAQPRGPPPYSVN